MESCDISTMKIVQSKNFKWNFYARSADLGSKPGITMQVAAILQQSQTSKRILHNEH